MTPLLAVPLTLLMNEGSPRASGLAARAGGCSEDTAGGGNGAGGVARDLWL